MPLTSTTGEDFWSVYLFDRFKNNGGQKALTVGTHHFKIEIRPYLKIDEKSEVKIGNLIADGSIDLIIKPTKISAKEIDIQPIMQNTDWGISSEKYDKKLIRELNKNIAENNFKEITSIVVIKNGKLLIEEYFNKAERNTLHDTRSVGKSFASALTGIAIKEGFLKSENQTLSEFYDLSKFQNYTSKKDSISIKNLLTMRSVFEGDDSDEKSAGNEENMYPTEDWVKFTLDLPINKNKQSWVYFTAGVVLLGDILNKSVPEGLEKYADKKLFQPLNIKNYQWQYTPQKVANTAGGLQMTALDYAKFGQLYQQKGRWKNQQILDAYWVEKTFTKRVSIPERANEFYGFLFWNKTFQINGKPYETFYCAGNGGSKIYIFKDLPITIVITAKAYNRPYGHLQVDKMMEDYILKAIFP
jgi:CubicO group peptidase (beta-lactamase class C family)